jgi:hypothetical protein
MRLRLTPRQRAILADKVPDVVNLVTAAIGIGFFVGEPRTPVGLFIASLCLWIAALMFAVIISNEKSP